MGCRDEWFEKTHSKCRDHKKHSKCWDDNDDCLKKFKECKKDHNEKCDCCCTTGIFRKLRELRDSFNLVTLILRGTKIEIVGVVESVNCDTVTIRTGRTTRSTVSLCEIIAVSEQEPEIASEIHAELLNIVKKNN